MVFVTLGGWLSKVGAQALLLILAQPTPFHFQKLFSISPDGWYGDYAQLSSAHFTPIVNEVHQAPIALKPAFSVLLFNNL